MGKDCDFCHLEHARRPSHLDKRHRQMMRELPVDEMLGLVVPVALDKARAMGVDDSSLALLENLSLLVAPDNCDRQVKPPQKSVGSLRSALRSLSLRTLLGLAQSTATAPVERSPRSHVQHQLVLALLAALRANLLPFVPQQGTF